MLLAEQSAGLLAKSGRTREICQQKAERRRKRSGNKETRDCLSALFLVGNTCFCRKHAGNTQERPPQTFRRVESKRMHDMQHDAKCCIKCDAYEAELLEAFVDAEN
jgi:hypothetical protein